MKRTLTLMTTLLILTSCGNIDNAITPTNTDSDLITDPNIDTHNNITVDDSDFVYERFSLYDYKYADETNVILVDRVAIGMPISTDGRVWEIEVADFYNGIDMSADYYIDYFKKVSEPHDNNELRPPFDFGMGILNLETYYNQNFTKENVNWEEVGIKKISDNKLQITTDFFTTAEGLMSYLATAKSSPMFNGEIGLEAKYSIVSLSTENLGLEHCDKNSKILQYDVNTPMFATVDCQYQKAGCIDEYKGIHTTTRYLCSSCGMSSYSHSNTTWGNQYCA